AGHGILKGGKVEVGISGKLVEPVDRAVGTGDQAVEAHRKHVDHIVHRYPPQGDAGAWRAVSTMQTPPCPAVASVLAEQPLQHGGHRTAFGNLHRRLPGARLPDVAVAL